jgi:hypothetical protein
VLGCCRVLTSLDALLTNALFGVAACLLTAPDRGGWAIGDRTIANG